MGTKRIEVTPLDVAVGAKFFEINAGKHTYRALAEKTGMNKDRIHRIFAGERPSTASEFLILCNALGVANPGKLLDDIIAEVERAELADTLSLAAHEHEGSFDGSTDEYGHPLDTIGEESQDTPHAD